MIKMYLQVISSYIGLDSAAYVPYHGASSFLTNFDYSCNSPLSSYHIKRYLCGRIANDTFL